MIIFALITCTNHGLQFTLVNQGRGCHAGGSQIYHDTGLVIIIKYSIMCYFSLKNYF